MEDSPIVRGREETKINYKKIDLELSSLSLDMIHGRAFYHIDLLREGFC
jgi:hypothetical protein